jgi:hypothetical protein
MNRLPYISSEGGPLLLADEVALREWKGSFHEGTDYERACRVVTNGHIGALDDGRILVWDIDGAGTAFLTSYDEFSLQLVRFWADEDPSEDQIVEMASLTTPTGERSNVCFTTSPAIVVWACEEITQMTLPPDALPGVPDGDWSMGGTVYSLPIAPGLYSAEVGRYESDGLAVLSLVCRRIKQSESGPRD